MIEEFSSNGLIVSSMVDAKWDTSIPDSTMTGYVMLTKILWFFLLVMMYDQAKGDSPVDTNGHVAKIHASVPSKTVVKPNILLILVDDLKPAMGCYGDRHAITPNLDRLADRGMRFDRAYCNQAVCAPSRYTLMLGSHATSTGLYDLRSILRDKAPDAVTMPQHFSMHGYRTESLGKIFHIGHGNFGDPPSFDVPHYPGSVVEYVLPESTDGGQLTIEEAFFTNRPIEVNGKKRPRGAAFEAPTLPDEAYSDGRIANEAIVRLEAASRKEEPFFIAVGFVKPHLPFCAPKKYWDLYDPNDLPKAKRTSLPIGAPPKAGKPIMSEIGNYKPVSPEALHKDALPRQLVHGYYAAVSYTDAQIGKVLDALDQLELADHTIVVVWGDHGFLLGELGMWTKHVNYERANHIPLIIVAPGITVSRTTTEHLTESVDIFPTLAALAGIPPPSGPQPIDGLNLVPVLRDGKVRLRDHAYHCYPKSIGLGRAIRTDRYRLVEWRNHEKDAVPPIYELYDYRRGEVEKRNIAHRKPKILRELRQILQTYPTPLPR